MVGASLVAEGFVSIIKIGILNSSQLLLEQYYRWEEWCVTFPDISGDHIAKREQMWILFKKAFGLQRDEARW